MKFPFFYVIERKNIPFLIYEKIFGFNLKVAFHPFSAISNNCGLLTQSNRNRTEHMCVDHLVRD